MKNFPSLAIQHKITCSELDSKIVFCEQIFVITHGPHADARRTHVLVSRVWKSFSGCPSRMCSLNALDASRTPMQEVGAHTHSLAFAYTYLAAHTHLESVRGVSSMANLSKICSIGCWATKKQSRRRRNPSQSQTNWPCLVLYSCSARLLLSLFY